MKTKVLPANHRINRPQSLQEQGVKLAEPDPQILEELTRKRRERQITAAIAKLGVKIKVKSKLDILKFYNTSPGTIRWCMGLHEWEARKAAA